MKKREVVDLLERGGLRPDRDLGQNFLLDEEIAGKIVASAGIETGEPVLEIGPGLGALTGRLGEASGNCTALEVDSGLFRALRRMYNDRHDIELVHGDALKTVPGASFRHVVSNLPYYCASEILFRVADLYPGARVTAMMQKEMALRLVASPGSREYGAMTVTLALRYHRERLFDVAPSSFYPRPEVTSTVVRLVPLGVRPEGEVEKALRMLVRSAFWGRRKTLRRALVDSPHSSWSRETVDRLLEESGILPRERGENLSPGLYHEMAKRLARLEGENP